ncbi:MAG: hypothetical protein VB137_04145 [Burkholderia sp.]
MSALGARNWQWPTDDEAPPEVQQRKAEVLPANDPLSTWIDEFDVRADLTVWTPKQEIYDHYCRVMSARAKSTRSKERVLDLRHLLEKDERRPARLQSQTEYASRSQEDRRRQYQGRGHGLAL